MGKFASSLLAHAPQLSCLCLQGLKLISPASLIPGRFPGHWEANTSLEPNKPAKERTRRTVVGSQSLGPWQQCKESSETPWCLRILKDAFERERSDRVSNVSTWPHRTVIYQRNSLALWGELISD